MKITILLIVILLCLSGMSASAMEHTTGSELFDSCKIAINTMEGRISGPQFKGGFCMGFVSGVWYSSNPSVNVCDPQGITLEQVMRVVIKYLVNHPEKFHDDAYFLVREALTNAFPCK